METSSVYAFAYTHTSSPFIFSGYRRQQIFFGRRFLKLLKNKKEVQGDNPERDYRFLNLFGDDYLCSYCGLVQCRVIVGASLVKGCFKGLAVSDWVLQHVTEVLAGLDTDCLDTVGF